MIRDHCDRTLIFQSVGGCQGRLTRYQTNTLQALVDYIRWVAAFVEE